MIEEEEEDNMNERKENILLMKVLAWSLVCKLYLYMTFIYEEVM